MSPQPDQSKPLCERCGLEFTRTHARQKYHPACQRLSENEAKNRRYRLVHPLPEVICDICAKAYTPDPSAKFIRAGEGLALRHPECQIEHERRLKHDQHVRSYSRPAIREVIKARSSTWREIHQEQYRVSQRENYQKHKTKRREKARIASAELRRKAKLADKAERFKGGWNKKDAEAKRVCALYDRGVPWAEITKQMNGETKTHRSEDAYQGLRKRYLERSKKPTARAVG